ncbi:hypothetical protein ACH5RR_009384 [Cinchona calisaya]|uniref:Integrase catalytic domain-containing protein n=1 Tax=Cinchona calisaya TaxID=153742 RepID=A0ABD3AH01_9GENT
MAEKMIQEKVMNSAEDKDWSYKDGVLRFRGKSYIGDQGEIKKKIIQAMHDSQLGGQSGEQASWGRAKILFYWPRMFRDFKEVIMQCDAYKRCKNDNFPYLGPFTALTRAKVFLESYHMDFIDGLPKSEGKEVIMLVVDRFTKVTHFYGLSYPYTATSVARVFMDNVYKLHGMPQVIVSDRDRIFISQFW